ncbi:MAG: hypothetical protein ACRD4Y_02330 [Candidatus Acidiferrales bacterium]
MVRRFLGLSSLILIFAVCAAAQGPAGAGSNSKASRSRGPRSSRFEYSEPAQWQFSIGYQYNRINLTGSPFVTHGLTTGITRYFGSWFGVDGQLGFGFGNTGATSSPSNLSAQSLFAGIGPRLAYRHGQRLEPWLHCVIGVEHFKFTQTAGVLGNNTALAGAAGGGVDYKLGPHTSLRAEADAIGSRFFSVNQRHFQVIGGLVFNF